MPTPSVYARVAAERDELSTLAERRGEALMASNLMRDALKRENDELHRKVRALFYAACSAAEALESQKTELARDILSRAKLAANT